MSSPIADRPGRIRPRDEDEQLHQSSDSSPARLAPTQSGESDESAAALVQSASARSDASDPSADAQPLPEQMRKKQRRSPRFSSPLDQLAAVELQLCLQFLDTKSKLIAARCSRRLLHAADHPFAWKGPSVAVSTFNRPHLGSLIRQSLLRHAPIALTVDSDVPVAEVAAIPRLRELLLADYYSSNSAVQLLALPPTQGLQTLRLSCRLPMSMLRLLPTLPALHTLYCKVWNDSKPWSPDDGDDDDDEDDEAGERDWSWLPAIPALTDLNLAGSSFGSLSQPSLDAVSQCTQLQSLRLRHPHFEAGAFARFCSSPALRQLRRLEIQSWRGAGALQSDEWRAAFSALAALESLHLTWVSKVDQLLPHVAHAPALRTLTIPCAPYSFRHSAAENPGREALRQLLAAAPLLAVRLQMAASLDEWRNSFVYRMELTRSADRQQMRQQWRRLMSAAELERVTITDPALAT